MAFQLFPTPSASRAASSPPSGSSYSQVGEVLPDREEDTSPHFSPACQPSTHGAFAGTQHAVEDSSEFTSATLRRVRLKLSSQTELKYAAKLSPVHRSIWMAAQILRVHDRLDDIQPVDAKWQIPETLWDKIEHFTFAGLVSPVLPFYLKDASPVRLVMGILEKHPHWGYTKEVKNNKSKHDVVKARVQMRLTDRRAAIKKAIMLSIGPLPQRESVLPEEAPNDQQRPQIAAPTPMSKKKQPEAVRIDIVKLCTAIANEHSESEVVVTVQMCARFAFLRHVYLQSVCNTALAGWSYWPLVDSQLDLLRAEYIGNPSSVTVVLTMMLNDDRRDYGHPDSQDEPSETSAVPNAKQRIADRAANGEFVEDDD